MRKTRGKIVAVANQKGGVGKTTLVLHIAEYAARKYEQRVVVIDADPQGNASSWLLGRMPEESGLYNVLVARQEIRAQVVDVARVLQEEDMEEISWHVYLVPGNWETGEAMRFVVSGQWDAEYIAQKVRPLADEFGLVLLDMPPSRLVGFRELLLAADGVLIPSILERLSLEGVVFMRDVVVELQRRYGYAPRLMGIVPNMVRLTTREHRTQLDELVRELEDAVWPPIPLSVRVAEASGYGRNLFDLAPRAEVTRYMERICERFWQATRFL